MPDGTVTKRKSKLLAVAPETVEPSKPKVLIFGPPGVGKTWASLDFPSVYYVDTEGGADLNHYREKLRQAGGVYLGPDQGSLDIEAVIGQVQALATEQHQYRTIVFDSISKLWNTALAEEQERLGDEDAFGAYKKQPKRRFNALIRWVNKLDMSAIFIAHQRELWGQNNKKQREVIGWTFDADEKLEYELHLVLRIFKTGGTRRAQIGKSRLLAFPESDVFEWGYQQFADRYGRDVIEKEAKPIELVTVETIAEIKRLLDVVKLPDGTVEKWFSKAGIDDWNEMTADIAEKCLGLLKGRIAS